VIRGHLRLVRPTDPNAPPPTDEQLARRELLRHMPAMLHHVQGDNITEMYLEAVKDYLEGMGGRR
jgi:primosomal protein N'